MKNVDLMTNFRGSFILFFLYKFPFNLVWVLNNFQSLNEIKENIQEFLKYELSKLQ